MASHNPAELCGTKPFKLLGSLDGPHPACRNGVCNSIDGRKIATIAVGEATYGSRKNWTIFKRPKRPLSRTSGIGDN